MLFLTIAEDYVKKTKAKVNARGGLLCSCCLVFYLSSADLNEPVVTLDDHSKQNKQSCSC